jgi:hypothetical protein
MGNNRIIRHYVRYLTEAEKREQTPSHNDQKLQIETLGTEAVV